MNILFFYLPAIAPDRGGVERVTAVLADSFESLGHHCFYLASLSENREYADKRRQFYLPNFDDISSDENFCYYKNFLAEKHIDVVIYQAGHKKFPWAKFPGHPLLICALHLDPCAYDAIVRDKILFKLAKYPKWLKFLITPFLNNVVAPLKIKLRKIKKCKVYRWNYLQCDKYIVLSSAYCKTLAAHISGGDVQNKIEYIPNPCSFHSDHKKYDKENFLLFVGRLCLNQKRPDLMLEIWSKIEKDFPGWHLEILGSGDNANEVKEMAKRKKLCRVNFRGFTPAEPFLKKAPFLCMTSSNEGFGMVLLEASVFGCIPIAFNAFPTAEDIIKNGKNGYLIKPFDVEAYVELLRNIMLSGSHIKADDCVLNAQRFSIENISLRWVNLFIS